MPYKHDYDRAMRRLSTIIQKLYGGEELSLKELSEEFGCSIRTIQRDISERLSSFPIEKNGQKFKMKKGFKIEKSSNPQDLLTLDMLERISEGMGCDFALRAKSLLSKLKNQDETPPIYAKIIMEDVSSKLIEITTLELCIRERKQISFKYEYENKKVDIASNPLKIVCFDGFWYLLGLDEEHDKVKKYYLNAISSIEIKNKKFRVPKRLQESLDNAINIWFQPEVEPFKVKLHIEPEIAKYFKRRPISKTQIVESIYNDGSYDISLKITSYNEVTRLILSWLPHMKVLEPKELDDMIREKIAGY